LCAEDNPTHLCPRLAEAQNFVTQQQQVVLTKPFQHGQNLTQASTRTEGGSQETYPPPNNPSFVKQSLQNLTQASTSTEGDYR
jgi:hypothetical protein